MMRVRVFLWQVKASVKSSFVNVITFKNIDDIVKKYCFFKKIYVDLRPATNQWRAATD
jgi:hypothetical protein